MTFPHIVAIAGGSASGKTTLAHDLLSTAQNGVAGLLSLDSYYRPHPNTSLEELNKSNFDHPDSFDIDLLITHLTALKGGDSIEAPVYNFATHNRELATTLVEPRPIILMEGIFVLWFEKVRELLTYSVFVEAPEEIRRKRRFDRDVRERGRTVESVAYQWGQNVQPMFLAYCETTKRYASEVVSGGSWEGPFIEALWARITAQCQI